MKAIVVVVGCLGVAVAALLAVFVSGLRRKSPLVLNAIRRMNRKLFNPRQRDAGQPGAHASLIRHIGRSSGADYETPVVAVETEDGFVIALPYGTHADWLKNVLASRSATIIHNGKSHPVGDPDIVAIESANAFFSPNDRRAHRFFGTDQCLRLRRVADPSNAATEMQSSEPTSTAT